MIYKVPKSEWTESGRVVKKVLNGQSEVFYFTANENSEIITNSALTKAVIEYAEK